LSRAYREPSERPSVPESLREPIWHRLLIVLLLASATAVFLLPFIYGGFNLGFPIYVTWTLGLVLSGAVLFDTAFVRRWPVRWRVVMVAWWPITWLVLGASRGLRWIVRGE